jgi:hypothetical protein
MNIIGRTRSLLGSVFLITGTAMAPVQAASVAVQPQAGTCEKTCDTQYLACLRPCGGSDPCLNRCDRQFERCVTACPGSDLDGDGVPREQDNCPKVANASQSDCDQDGLGDACETDPGVFVFKEPTMLLCHFDADKNLLSGFTVEIYTADAYRDSSCLKLPDRYRKRMVTSVHCGFNLPSTCENRVARRAAELVAQGYKPPASSPGDQCPQPRI